jgi:hypothetical protein
MRNLPDMLHPFLDVLIDVETTEQAKSTLKF